MNEINDQELLRTRLRALRLEAGDLVEVEAETPGGYALRMRPEFATLVAQMRHSMGGEVLRPHGVLFLNELARLSVRVYREAQRVIAEGLTEDSIVGVDDLGFVIGSVAELLHGSAKAALSAYENERGGDEVDTLREYEAGERAGERWVAAFRASNADGSIAEIEGGINLQVGPGERVSAEDLALLVGAKRKGAPS